jgi:hypothetical protein
VLFRAQRCRAAKEVFKIRVQVDGVLAASQESPVQTVGTWKRLKESTQSTAQEGPSLLSTRGFLAGLYAKLKAPI